MHVEIIQSNQPRWISVLTLVLTTDARVLPRLSPVAGGWFVVGAGLGADGALVGAPGL